MRTEAQVEEFEVQARACYLDGCAKCGGTRIDCCCWAVYSRAMKLYEACIPNEFWELTRDDVVHNVEVFEEVILPYTHKLSTALRRGYGLILTGDNGTGKTFFMYLIADRAITRGFSVYYTTMLDLIENLKRASFADREEAKAIRTRLDWYLTSDFVMIDELGKEQYKGGDSWSRTQFERIAKDRSSNSQPVVLASNASLDELEKIYGTTLSSVLEGRYQQVSMEPGDYRAQLRARMRREMAPTPKRGKRG